MIAQVAGRARDFVNCPAQEGTHNNAAGAGQLGIGRSGEQPQPLPAGLLEDAPLVMVRKRSCPAVSQICSLTHLPSISTFLILKSILQEIGGSHGAMSAAVPAPGATRPAACRPPPPATAPTHCLTRWW